MFVTVNKQDQNMTDNACSSVCILWRPW